MARSPALKIPVFSGTLLPLSAIHGLRCTGAICPAQCTSKLEPCFSGNVTVCVVSMICKGSPRPIYDLYQSAVSCPYAH